MNKTYKSDILAAVHEAASDLREAGVLYQNTMQCFDELCLSPDVKVSAKKRLRDIPKESAIRPKANHD